MPKNTEFTFTNISDLLDFGPFLLPTAAAGAEAVLELLHEADFGFVIIVLIAFILAWGLFEVFEEDGQEEVEENDVADDKKENEEDDVEFALHPHVVVHHTVPVFADEDDEYGEESRPEVIEVQPGRDAVLSFGDHQVLLCVDIFDFVAIELHSQEGEDEHENQHEHCKIPDIFHSNNNLFQQNSERHPRSGKLKDSEETHSSQSRQSSTTRKINVQDENEEFKN